MSRGRGYGNGRQNTSNSFPLTSCLLITPPVSHSHLVSFSLSSHITLVAWLLTPDLLTAILDTHQNEAQGTSIDTLQRPRRCHRLPFSSSVVSAGHDRLARCSTRRRTARPHICLGLTLSTTIRSTCSHTHYRCSPYPYVEWCSYTPRSTSCTNSSR